MEKEKVKKVTFFDFVKIGSPATVSRDYVQAPQPANLLEKILRARKGR
jgi:hypothetical protein